MLGKLRYDEVSSTTLLRFILVGIRIEIEGLHTLRPLSIFRLLVWQPIGVTVAKPQNRSKIVFKESPKCLHKDVPPHSTLVPVPYQQTSCFLSANYFPSFTARSG